MPSCTRHTCGFSYSSIESSEYTSTPCFHHPGQPIFHEGSKSWSCCKEVNKPVLDFDDFLKIKGCKEEVGHSNVKTEKKKTDEEKTKETQQAMEGIKLEDGREVYGQASTSKNHGTATSSVITPSVGPCTSTSATTAPKKQEYIEPSDPEGEVIPPNTTCKRPGCTATSSDSSSPRNRSSEECNYHKGPPIFHDSSKGYLCCKRRVLEFDEFLKIEGCTKATTGHLFIQPPKTIKKPNGSVATTEDSSQDSSASSQDSLLQKRGLILRAGEEEVDCKMDHYETPDEIRMTIYCKGVQMDKSTILIEEEDLLLSLAMPPLPASSSSRRHLLHLPLYAAVLPAVADGESKEGSYYTVSPSKIKIDIILKKKQAGISWPRLDRSGQDVGYGLTFGRK